MSAALNTPDTSAEEAETVTATFTARVETPKIRSAEKAVNSPLLWVNSRAPATQEATDSGAGTSSWVSTVKFVMRAVRRAALTSRSLDLCVQASPLQPASQMQRASQLGSLVRHCATAAFVFMSTKAQDPLPAQSLAQVRPTKMASGSMRAAVLTHALLPAPKAPTPAKPGRHSPHVALLPAGPQSSLFRGLHSGAPEQFTALSVDPNRNTTWRVASRSPTAEANCASIRLPSSVAVCTGPAVTVTLTTVAVLAFSKSNTSSL